MPFPYRAWYQYDCAKKKKPTRSLVNIPEGISAYMEIEVPDNEVQLSDFDLWHAVLNQGPLEDWKKMKKTFKEIERLEKVAGRRLEYAEYPQPLRDRIEKTWEGIFDLERRGA